LTRAQGDEKGEAVATKKKPVAKWAGTRDWEPHRDKLTRLWWHENKTMEEVKTIMEQEEGFCAT
jgi:hypothetical protein